MILAWRPLNSDGVVVTAHLVTPIRSVEQLYGRLKQSFRELLF